MARQQTVYSHHCTFECPLVSTTQFSPGNKMGMQKPRATDESSDHPFCSKTAGSLQPSSNSMWSE